MICFNNYKDRNYFEGIDIFDQYIYISIEYFYKKYKIENADEKLFIDKFWNTYDSTKIKNLSLLSIDKDIMPHLVKSLNKYENHMD